MAKYHVDRNGNPALCRATVNPCPLGGSEIHGDSKEEVYEIIAQQSGGSFSKTVKKQMFGGGANMHTDITEGAGQVFVILETSGIDTSQVTTRDDLVQAIDNLPENVNNKDLLENLRKKLVNENRPGFLGKIDNKIMQARIIGAKTTELLRNTGLSDEYIRENIEWSGKVDPRQTTADLQCGDIDISLKGNGSPALNHTGLYEGSRRWGFPEDETPFNQPVVEQLEAETLETVGGNLLAKLAEGEVQGAWREKKYSWRQDGDDIVYTKDNGAEITVPRKAFESFAEWKKLGGAQQQALAKYITCFNDDLKTATNYGEIVEKRNHALGESLSNNFPNLSARERKSAFFKALGARSKACYYVSVGENGTVKDGYTPSLNDLMADDRYEVGDTVVQRGPGIYVSLLDKEEKTFTTIRVRARPKDGQLNYGNLQITTEFMKSLKTVPELETEMKSKGYGFVLPTEQVLKKQ